MKKPVKLEGGTGGRLKRSANLASEREDKSRSAVDSVDKLNEIKWCDHVYVSVDFLKASVPTALITSPLTYLIVEDGKIKLLCGNCLRVALAHRQDFLQSH